MSTTQAQPCYLYGFMRPPNAPIPQLTGVFGAPVETQVHGDLAVVVSAAPSSPQRAARDDVLAHSDVLQALIVDHDVVPASFGTVYPSGIHLGELPRGERRSISKLLDNLAGRVEYQVRATYNEVNITAALVDSDARLKRLRAKKQQDYGTQLAIGSRFAEVLDRRRRQDADAAGKKLAKAADQVLGEAPSGEWGAYRFSLLVSRRKQDDVESALRDLADSQAAHLTLDWVGPLPAYSFTQLPANGRAG